MESSPCCLASNVADWTLLPAFLVFLLLHISPFIPLAVQFEFQPGKIHFTQDFNVYGKRYFLWKEWEAIINHNIGMRAVVSRLLLILESCLQDSLI